MHKTGVKNIDGVKYFDGKQIKLLRRTVRVQASAGKLTHIREWMPIDTWLKTSKIFT